MDKDNVDIIVKMQSGDKVAFGKVFELYKINAVRTAYLISGNKALAEDIAQEAFIQCYKEIKTLKDPAIFRTWFYKILTRIAWRVCAREKTITPDENILQIADGCIEDQAEQSYFQNELSTAILASIDRLETKQRTVVFLYYYDGFSISEISKIMNCFEGTVKSRLHTARKNLKRMFATSGDFEKEVISNVKLYEIR